MAIHPGEMLAGYRVTRLLGRGGMGEVWAATKEAGDGAPARTVAIKVLLARAAMKPDLVRRFEREAAIATTLKSPFVCQLIEISAAEDGAPLLVFEHLSGESLADRLKREQYLPLSEVGPIIEDVLRGLVDAHAGGVIHRDLKPGNIFLVDRSEGGERSERAKILDFGISKLTKREGAREPTLTAFDATLGSFAYMAPEQVRGAARADERADIYAVGSVAFRALAGRLPFEGNNAAALVAMKLERVAPSLAQATGERWPAGVERFLERALDRAREGRYSTAAEALEAWRAVQPSSLRASSPELEAALDRELAAQRPPERPARSTPPPPPRRSPLPSYPLVEDNPTEVDEAPTMTVDGHYVLSGPGQGPGLPSSTPTRRPPPGKP